MSVILRVARALVTAVLVALWAAGVSLEFAAAKLTPLQKNLSSKLVRRRE